VPTAAKVWSAVVGKVVSRLGLEIFPSLQRVADSGWSCIDIRIYNAFSVTFLLIIDMKPTINATLTYAA
jgi:hypothetical protein